MLEPGIVAGGPEPPLASEASRVEPYVQRLRDSDEIVGAVSLVVPSNPATVVLGSHRLTASGADADLRQEATFLLLRRAFDTLGARHVHQQAGRLHEAAAETAGSTPLPGQQDLTVNRVDWPTMRHRLVDSFALTVRHDPEAGRYEGWLTHEPVTVLQYVERDGEVLVTHTGTQPAWRDAGLAGRLTAVVLDGWYASGIRVRPLCSYTRRFMRDHPQYAPAG